MASPARKTRKKASLSVAKERPQREAGVKVNTKAKTKAKPKEKAESVSPKRSNIAKRDTLPRKKELKAPTAQARMVRDSFTMPKADFDLIATLKVRAMAGGRETKKSELLRAGLQALATLDRPSLLRLLGELEAVKIGRPKTVQGHD